MCVHHQHYKELKLQRCHTRQAAAADMHPHIHKKKKKSTGIGEVYGTNKTNCSNRDYLSETTNGSPVPIRYPSGAIKTSEWPVVTWS